MAALGAGLRFDAGTIHVEGGYRYVAIFSDFRTISLSTGTVITHFNSVYGALGVRF